MTAPKDKLLEFLEEYYKEIFAFEEEMVHEKRAYDKIRKIITQHFSISEEERKEARAWIDQIRCVGYPEMSESGDRQIVLNILKALGEPE